MLFLVFFPFWLSLYIFIERIFLKRIQISLNLIEDEKKEVERLQKQIHCLQKDNESVNKEIQETVTLYEITKDMCGSLDEDEVFNVFKERLGKYIKIDHAQFLRHGAQDTLTSDYLKIPLNIEQQDFGILAVKGLTKHDEDKFFILSAQLLLAIRRAHFYRKIQELAITDSSTGALSRRYCMERFREELERSNRFNLKFCVLMSDIDHFKKYNDRYGHLVGDVILKEVVQVIRQNLRHVDLVGRYGGEEFFILLPETDKDNGIMVAERIRSRIETNTIFAYDESLKVTISIGVASFPEDAADAQELIDKADWALYRCKNTGRNRVCAYKVYK